jgi:hypothetical protein
VFEFNQVAANRSARDADTGAQILQADEILPRECFLNVFEPLNLIHRELSACATAALIMLQRFKILQTFFQNIARWMWLPGERLAQINARTRLHSCTVSAERGDGE